MFGYGADSAAQTAPASDPGWRFTLTPYVWAPSIEGKLRYTLPDGRGGARGADVGVDAVNLLQALNFAAMITGEARYGRYSVLSDFIYLDLGSSTSQVRAVDFFEFGRNPVSTTLNTGTKTALRGGLASLAGGYTLLEGDWGQLDAQAGIRVFWLSARTDVRLAADISGPGPGQSFARTARLKGDAELYDGIAGIRGRFELGGGFHVPFAADVGGGSSQLTWQAAAGVGYRTGWGSVALGYRHLSYEQSGNRLIRELSLGGPFLAANFVF